MKWNWYIPLTGEQFEKLKAGLKSYFRFHLNLAFETVTYNDKTNVLTVNVVEGTKKELVQELSLYINGYSQAVS